MSSIIPVAKPTYQTEVAPYLDYYQVMDYIAAQLGKTSMEMHDFWHWFISENDLSNDSFVLFDLDRDIDEEDDPNIIEIYKFLLKEFTEEDQDSINFWVSW